MLFNWHGWAQSPDNQNKRINARDFANKHGGMIIAPSDEPCPNQDSWVACSSEQMKSVVDWAKNKYSCINREAVIFGAYSAGGQAAYRYIADYPNEVRGMITLAANGQFVEHSITQEIHVIHAHGENDKAPFYARCGNYPCFDGPSPTGGRQWVLDEMGNSLNCAIDEMQTDEFMIGLTSYQSESWSRESCDYGSSLQVLTVKGAKHDLTLPKSLVNRSLRKILNLR